MNWPFRRTRNAKKEKALPLRERNIPLDEERRGPAPPPPRTAHAPGVSVYSFSSIPSQHLLRGGEGYGGFFLEGDEGRNRTSALLVLWAGSERMDFAAAGAAAALGGGGAPAPPPPALGDVLIWTTALAAPPPPGTSSLSPLEEISRTSPRPLHHIRRDDLGGKSIPGITGLRTLLHLPTADLAVLRIGPPPTARWAFRGVRTIAVFSGKITLVDDEEARLVRAGSLAFVDDPSATLYLEAGNDAALAVALATSGFVAALS